MKATGAALVTQDAFVTSTFEEYDAFGNVRTRVDSDDTGLTRKYQFTYDPTGVHLATTTDPKGYVTELRYNEEGLLIAVLAPEGGATQFEYDASGRISRSTDAEGHSTDYFYHINGQLRRLVDARGEETTWKYGPAKDIVTAAKPTTITGPTGTSVDYQYDAVGNLTSVLDTRGNATLRAYDLVDRLVWQRDELLGREQHFDYDGNGNLITHIDEAGRTTRYKYDAVNRILRTVDPLDQETTTQYRESRTQKFHHITKGGRVRDRFYVQRTNSHRGLTTTVHTDSRGLVIQTLAYPTDKEPKDARRSQLEYDGFGRLTRHIDPAGYQEHRSYDKNGNVLLAVLTNAKLKILSYTAYEYDKNNRVTTQINGRGYKTQFEYDGTGRITAVIDDDGTRTEYDYDPLGNPIQIKDGLGNTTQFQYDPAGRPTATIDPLGHVTQRVYNPYGEMTQIIDPLQNTTHYQYDSRGRLQRTIDATNAETHYEYDRAGNLSAHIDPLGSRTTFWYDEINRPILVIDPLGRKQEQSHDSLQSESFDALGNPMTTQFSPFGEPSSLIDAKGATKNFIPNAMGRIAAKTDVASDARDHRETTKYNGLDLPALFIAADGTKTKYHYNPLGQLRLVEVLAPGESQYRTEQEFAYDNLSRMTLAIDHNEGRATHAVEFEYDKIGRLTAEIQDGIRIEYRYDKASRRTGIVYPDARVDLTWKYDARGRPIMLIDADGNHTIRYKHNARGQTRRVEITAHRQKANHLYITNITRDHKGRETDRSFSHRSRGKTTKLMTSSLEYDRIDNIVHRQVKNLTPHAADTTSWQYTYTYDDTDRLTDAQTDDGDNLYWSYDPTGNWLETNQNGEDETRAINDHDQYTHADIRHDDRGNLKGSQLGQFTYDWDNRMITGHTRGPQVKFTYDALGRRVTKTVITGAIRRRNVRYIYDGQQVIEERNGRGTILRSFINGPNIDDPLILSTDSNHYYYFKDHQASVLALAAPNEYIENTLQETYHYAPYGAMTVWSNNGNKEHKRSPIGNPYGFTGRRWDHELQLWHYRNRTYDDKLGRFYQKDPLGFVDGTNRYAYVGNNPCKFIDPLGLAKRTQHTESLQDAAASFDTGAVQFSVAGIPPGRVGPSDTAIRMPIGPRGISGFILGINLPAALQRTQNVIGSGFDPLHVAEASRSFIDFGAETTFQTFAMGGPLLGRFLGPIKNLPIVQKGLSKFGPWARNAMDLIGKTNRWIRRILATKLPWGFGKKLPSKASATHNASILTDGVEGTVPVQSRSWIRNQLQPKLRPEGDAGIPLNTVGFSNESKQIEWIGDELIFSGTSNITVVAPAAMRTNISRSMGIKFDLSQKTTIQSRSPPAYLNLSSMPKLDKRQDAIIRPHIKLDYFDGLN